MEYVTLGRTDAPALVCMPGLLGGAEDFRTWTDAWAECFHIFIPDPNAERRKNEGINLSVQAMQEVSYDSTSADVADILRKEGKTGAFVTGISLGGKVVYDFAAKFPQMFLGGVVTDVGPSSFQETTLYAFVDDIVQTLKLSQPWAELKEELRTRIPDRSMRSLIQSQLFYPTKAPPAEWKTGMKNFRKLLHRQGIDEQFEALRAVDAELAAKDRFIDIMQAETHSGISAASLPELRALKSVRLHYVPNSTHFLHLTHKGMYQDLVLSLVQAQ